jgi:hypothetical protein
LIEPEALNEATTLSVSFEFQVVRLLAGFNSLNHATSHARTAAAQRRRMVRMVVATRMNHQ